MLILFGGKDHIVPVGPNRSRLDALLAEAGNTQAQIVTIENDLAMLAKTGVRSEYTSLNRFDRAYFETLTAFLNRMARARESGVFVAMRRDETAACA